MGWDKEVAEVIRPAPVQATCQVPLKSVACAKLQSRILSAAEAVQAAKLPQEMPPEQQAIILSARALAQIGLCISPRQRYYKVPEGGHSTAGRCDAPCWTSLHVCLAQRQRRRHVRAVAGDAPFSLFLLQVRGSQGQTAPSSPVHVAQAYPAGCPRALRLGEKQKRSGTRGAVCHLGRGLLVPGCPAATLDRRQRAMPACRTLHRKCVETRVRCSCGETEKMKRYGMAGMAVRSLAFETHGRLGGEGTKLTSRLR